MMKKFGMLVLVGAVAVVTTVFSAASQSEKAKQPEKTMTVPRCQALDKKGNQCTAQVQPGTPYCWRHRGFMKTMNETLDDAGKGAKETWQSVKGGTTNAWEKTKSGAQAAWDATKEAADDARVGLVELLGGEDAKKKKE